MITVGTDNLDRHTTFVSYSFYGGEVYRKIYESDSVLCKEPLLNNAKCIHQYAINLYSLYPLSV